MKITDQISESLNTLRLNKMRTGLAALGIVIGIGSVIALISIGQSSKKSIESQIQSLGSNLLTISASFQRVGNVRSQGNRETLTNEDAIAIATSPKISTIKYVSSEYTNRSQIVTGSQNTNTSVIGATAVYATVHNIEISSGRFLTETDESSKARVVVLGPTVVTDLFGDGSLPLGEKIRINGQYFVIIGITTAKGGSGPTNQDDRVYIPLSVAQKQLFGSKYLSSIAVEANSADVMSQAMDEIGYLLLERHHLTDPSKADFSILSQADILSTVSQITGTFTTLLSGIAAISLLVGGIGIMNIMLVTVTERTREIGLRKALGAKRKTIITQFLIESVILTFIGGIIGVLLGISLAYLYSHFTSSLFYISGSSIPLAFVVSSIIGIIFGWYPAHKASNLQPIEALRYE